MTRPTPQELREYGQAMRDLGIIDFTWSNEGGRIMLSPNAPILTTTGVNVDPLKSIEPYSTTPLDLVKLTEEDENLLFASAT